jgi:hypothetical protein
LHQVNGNQIHLLLPVYEFIEKTFSNCSIDSLKQLIRETIEALNLDRVRIVLDEVNYIVLRYPGRFLSKNGKLRSLLTFLVELLPSLSRKLQISLSGTEFTVSLLQLLNSAFLRINESPENYTDYKFVQTPEKVIEILGKWLDLSEIDFNNLELQNHLRMLVGRMRHLTTTVESLPDIIKENTTITDKGTLLQLAIQKTFMAGVKFISERLSTKFSSYEDSTKTNSEQQILKENLVDIVETLSFSYSIKTKLKFVTKEQCDLVSLGLTVAEKTEPVVVERRGYEFKATYHVIRELTVAYGCFEFLSSHKKDISLMKRVYKELTDHVQLYRFTDPSQGKLFERCVFASLCDMQQQYTLQQQQRQVTLQQQQVNSKPMTMSDLPIFSQESIGVDPNTALPKWMFDVPWKLSSGDYGTFIELRQSDDFQCLEQMQLGSIKPAIVMPKTTMGPDGICLYPHDGLQSPNSSVYIVSISCKMYSNGVPWHEHLKSFKTTDPQWCYSEQITQKFKDNNGKEIEKHYEDLNQADLKLLKLGYDGGNLSSMVDIIPKLFKPTDKTEAFRRYLEPLKIGGILRIHVEWISPETCPKLLIDNNNKIVSIWITQSNLKYLLPKDVVEVLDSCKADDILEDRTLKRRRLN